MKKAARVRRAGIDQCDDKNYLTSRIFIAFARVSTDS